MSNLIDLHRGNDRQAPGDADFSLEILRDLATFLPPQPRIADLGCGSGAGALLLAQHFHSTVMAVDASAVFIDELKARAQQLQIEHLIVPIHGDMAKLDWPMGSIDLLWSEGAAYHLGFEEALSIWRPLLANNGIVVISELSWFTNDVPEVARTYWQNGYPQMGTETDNSERASRSGFRVLFTRRLPTQAWWVNYYQPLRDRIQQLEITPSNRLVIQETEAEMSMFERFSDFYGYTFYAMQAA